MTFQSSKIGKFQKSAPTRFRCESSKIGKSQKSAPTRFCCESSKIGKSQKTAPTRFCCESSKIGKFQNPIPHDYLVSCVSRSRLVSESWWFWCPILIVKKIKFSPIIRGLPCYENALESENTTNLQKSHDYLPGTTFWNFWISPETCCRASGTGLWASKWDEM